MRQGLILLVTASGCTPGHISWVGVDDDLRTVLIEDRPDGSTRILLSNGELPGCVVPSPIGTPDPAAISAIWAQLGWAACREDARHVLLTVRDGNGEWTFEDKEVSGVALGVVETATDGGDGLVPELAEAEVAYQDLAQEIGTVVLDEERGRVDVPDLDLHARFSHATCPQPGPDDDTWLRAFDQVWGGNPLVLCTAELSP